MTDRAENPQSSSKSDRPFIVHGQRIVDTQPVVSIPRLTPDQIAEATQQRSDSRPVRLPKPRQVLTYDEDFQQMISVSVQPVRYMLHLEYPLYDLGIMPQDSREGVRVGGLHNIATAGRVCHVGDIVIAVNDVPICTAMDFIIQLASSPSSCSIVVKHSKVLPNP